LAFHYHHTGKGFLFADMRKSGFLMMERPLMVQPGLAAQIGLNEAIFLQQLAFLLDLENSGEDFDGEHWVYNTNEQWLRIFPFWSERTLQRLMQELEQCLIIVTKTNKSTNKRYFRLNSGMVAKLQKGEIKGNQELEQLIDGGDKLALPAAKLAPPRAILAPPHIYTETTQREHIAYPENLKTEEFKAAWVEWVSHRKQLKKPLTATSVKRQLSKLSEMGPDRATKAILFSILNGWTGIYEEKQVPASGQRPQAPAVDYAKKYGVTTQ
jgi:hypothetical protein